MTIWHSTFYVLCYSPFKTLTRQRGSTNYAKNRKSWIIHYLSSRKGLIERIIEKVNNLA